MDTRTIFIEKARLYGQTLNRLTLIPKRLPLEYNPPHQRTLKISNTQADACAIAYRARVSLVCPWAQASACFPKLWLEDELNN
ncbi:MAG: hypothetical protein JJE09_09255 [Bacteroidia bacterium]|nr:hypothetical protein [Bacteroidia bacterium]